MCFFVLMLRFLFFFFKQKMAYEMRMSDWSSDVCSSDLNMGDDNGRGIAVSTDMGQTWQAHSTSFNALPEPTCMASLYRHEFEKNGRRQSVLLFSNPDSKKFRENLTIKLSLDNGKTWQEQNQLLLDEERGRGYYCLTSVGEDYIGILYESSQADLVFQKISLSSLLEGK